MEETIISRTFEKFVTHEVLRREHMPAELPLFYAQMRLRACYNVLTNTRRYFEEVYDFTVDIDLPENPSVDQFVEIRHTDYKEVIACEVPLCFWDDIVRFVEEQKTSNRIAAMGGVSDG